MEKESHQFRITASWLSGRTGIAKCDTVPSVVRFAAPAHFGGIEGRWTPEDLLLTAVASCYTSTFRALADYSRFEYADLEVEATGTVQKLNSGYAFGEIVTHPVLTLVRAEDHGRALRLLEKAQGLCLVARALSAKHSFMPTIEVAENSVLPKRKNKTVVASQSRESVGENREQENSCDAGRLMIE
jgi:peroxiredoxin-like protein